MTAPNESSKCPSEVELSAYVDNALTESDQDQISRHIETCPACQKRVVSLQKLGLPTDRVAPLSGNGDCPGWEEWGQFLEGHTSWGGRRRLDRHLIDCPRCRAEFVRHRLEEIKEDKAPGREILSLVKGIVAHAEKLAHPPQIRPPRPRVGFQPWFLAAASVAALFLVAFLLLGEFWKQRNGADYEPKPDRDAEWVETKSTEPGPEESPGRPDPVEPARELEVEPGPGPFPEPPPAPEDVPAPPEEVVKGPQPGEEKPEPASGEPSSPPTPAGAPEVEKPEEKPEEGKGKAAVTRSEKWERSEMQTRVIRGDQFGSHSTVSRNVLGFSIPLPREGSPGVAVRVKGKELFVDADGDGQPEKLVKRKGGIVQLQLAHAGGAPAPYWVEFFRKGEQWCYRPRTARAGKIAGITAHLFDENGNGRFNDPGIDTIAIDSASNYAFVGSVALLGENLYRIKINDSGTTVETKLFEGEVGYVDIRRGFRGGAAQVVTAILSNDQISINATALGWIVPVPVGKYRLHHGAIRAGREFIRFSGSEEAVIEVSAGERTTPNWGGPLTLEFKYTRGAENVSFRTDDLHFTGALGEIYLSPNRAKERTRVTIRDWATGRILKDQTAMVLLPVSSGGG